MVLLDSNVWVALFNEGDSFHEQAVRIFEQIEDEEIILPYVIAAETATVLTYKLSKKAANFFLETAINNQGIQIINNDFPREAIFFLGFKEKMSFQDFSLVFLAKQKGYKLLTFDKQQEKLLRRISGPTA